MKKYFVLSAVAAAALIFVNCNPGKKVSDTQEPAKVVKSTYATDMVPLISANCSPCHIPAKGGRKKAYDNYLNVKADIEDMLKRIQLNPTDRGFMPFKATSRLPDSTINAFKKWRDDGMLEN